jgi:osomolarity two-component system sensor histidine kinase NIK1
MAMNLTGQVRSISLVTKAVALGDLTQMVEVDVKGEMLDLKNTINGMVTQLHTLASEITRVSIEVGTEGKLGGQAMVVGTTGMWKVGKLYCAITRCPNLFHRPLPTTLT